MGISSTLVDERIARCPVAIKLAALLVVLSAIGGFVVDVILFTNPPAHPIPPDIAAHVRISAISTAAIGTVFWIILAIALVKGKYWTYYLLLGSSWLLFRMPHQTRHSFIWIVLWLVFMTLMLIGGRRYCAFANPPADE